jgi:hypothetical protein
MIAPGQVHSIHIELRVDGTAPTGHVRRGDDDPRAFSGWVGLVNAVEALITETPEPARSAQ